MSTRCTPLTPLRQLGWFAAVGAASTAAQAVIYLLSRQALSFTAASAVALVLTTALNTEAHRRLTFRGSRPAPALRVHLQAGATSAVAYALVLAVVLGLDALPPDAQPSLEVAVLTAAGAVVGLLRFAALRVWVFPARRVGGAHNVLQRGPGVLQRPGDRSERRMSAATSTLTAHSERSPPPFRTLSDRSPRCRGTGSPRSPPVVAGRDRVACGRS